MHVVLDHRDGYSADLELMLGRRDATVGDLVGALHAANGSSSVAGATTGIILDGRFCYPDLALDEIGLHEGARVRVAAARHLDDSKTL